jgi:hypothetical protein
LKTSSFPSTAKPTAHADSHLLLLLTTNSLAKQSKSWTELTCWVATSVSTKPKNAGPSKTAVAVAAVATKAAAETVVVVVVDVTTAVAVDATVIAVVAVDATTGKPALQRNFKKGSPRGGPFLFSEPPVITGQGRLKRPILFLRSAADLMNQDWGFVP